MERELEFEQENLYESEGEAEFEQLLEQLEATLHEARPGAQVVTQSPLSSGTSIFYVTINGSQQGKFKGGVIRKGQEGKMEGRGFRYELSIPRDAASGQATGKRQHKPIRFTKPIDSSTPQIFQALVTNEQLSVVLFEFRQANMHGVEQLFYTIKLTNASVAELIQSTGNSSGQKTELLEEVALTFQKIEVQHLIGKTAATDMWGSLT